MLQNFLTPQAYGQLKAEKIKRQARLRPDLTAQRSHLLAFTRYTMPEYQANWHHELVCKRLDAFARLEIKRLMIFMPPRHGKSELVSRRLPAFILGRNPDAPIIATSYGADLARRMNRDVQRIIDGPQYQEVFPETKLFGANVRTVAQGTWLRNSDVFEVVGRKGYYQSSGVGGGITGLGMLYGIVDDPIKNRQEANSLTVRNSVWDWYTSTFRTRLAPDGAILITVTRWHEDDLAGRLLALAESDPNTDQWEVVILPAVAEEPIAIYDEREPGAALWANRFDLKALEATRLSIGAYDWAALYQQRPSPREGSIFKRSWLEIVPGAPRPARICIRIRYWDKAGTKDAGAHTAGLLLSYIDGIFYIEDLVMGQWASTERERIIRQTAQADAAKYGRFQELDNGLKVMEDPGHVIGVEQEPGSGGKESAENTIASLPGFVVYADRPSGDKATRAEPIATQAEAGNVKMVSGSWNTTLLDILTTFPNGIKDPVDALSGAAAGIVAMMQQEETGPQTYHEEVIISPY